MFIFGTAFLLLRGLIGNRAQLAAENLALRQQLAVLKLTTPRPKIRRSDRVFWAWLARLWAGWRTVLVVVKPETVVRWLRQGFRLYWRWKSRGSPVGEGPPAHRSSVTLTVRWAGAIRDARRGGGARGEGVQEG